MKFFTCSSMLRLNLVKAHEIYDFSFLFPEYLVLLFIHSVTYSIETGANQAQRQKDEEGMQNADCGLRKPKSDP